MDDVMSGPAWLRTLARHLGVDRRPAQTAPPVPPAAVTPEETESAARAAFDAGSAAFRAKDYAAAADCFRAVIERRHDDADAHNYLGLSYLEQGSHEDAADSLALALHFRPQFPEALHNFALVEQQRGDFKEAVASLEQAITLKPDLAGAHNNLGYILIRELGDFERGAEHIRIALRLTPSDPDVLCNYTMVLIQEGRPEEAFVICDQQLAMKPDLYEARLNRALAALKLGRFATAWPDYEARKLTRSNYIPRPFVFPEWHGEPLTGKTVLVYAEQGLGDEIMFASCLPDIIARVGRCVLECTPRLERLLRRSFPGTTVHATEQANADTSWLAQVGPVDYQVAIGSLPGFFRRQWSDFPRHAGYLDADAARVDYWRERLRALGARINIGISWRGGELSTRRQARSIQLTQLLPIMQRKDVAFVSLQYGECRAEIEALLQSAGIRVHHWQEAIDDYDETAALVGALDLVVSVQTAAVHLAGALDKPAWVLVPAVPEWRYLQSGNAMPWYPSVRLYRQQHADNWQRVIAEVAAEIARLT